MPGVMLRSLVEGFSPWWLRFTYRDIARERGAYPSVLPPGYRPYIGWHEPPDRTLSPRRARVVYDAVMAARTDRVAEISRVLEIMGLLPATDPLAWNAIGTWLMESLQGSREPCDIGAGSRARPTRGAADKPESTVTLRPLWESVVLDLSLLLGEHMIAAAPGPGARWCFEGEWQPTSRAGDPRVASLARASRKGEIVPARQPFWAVRRAAELGLARREGVLDRLSDPLRLGDELRRLLDEPSSAPVDPTAIAAAALIEALEAHLDAHGDLPGDEEIVALLVDARLSGMPDLPPRLAAILDERDRRAGRSAEQSWRAM